MKNDQELMTKEFDSIPTTTHAAMQHASKQECLSIPGVRGTERTVLVPIRPWESQAETAEDDFFRYGRDQNGKIILWWRPNQAENGIELGRVVL